jgi:hypothetical protein
MRRILTVMTAALVMAALVLVMAMPALAAAEDNDAAAAKCSEDTLDGRYLFSYDGYEIKGNKKVPFAVAGYEVYDGNGHVRGAYSGNFGGEVVRNQPIRGTYTVNADCTGTVRYTDGTQVDQFVSPDGSQVAFVQTNPPEFVSGGLEVRGTKTRVGD